jgi:hypothetical protein
MSDDFAAALYAVYSNPLPGREAELHAWYEDVHIPDSLERGLFDSVRRYRARIAGRATFLTLWDCGYRDEEGALAAVRPVAEELRSAGRVEVVQEVVFQQFVFLESVIREREAGEGRFLTTLHSCWARPDSLPSFEAWMEGERRKGRFDEGAVARYGVPAPRSKALVLVEAEVAESDRGKDLVDHAEPGLPPFGPATPIFVSGSPAPAPPAEEPPDDARMASWKPAWSAQWELISAR